MVFSRFWYLVVGVAVAGALFLAYAAVGVTNHHAERATARLLNANSVAVSLYLKDDATRRANALTPLAVHPDVADALRKAQSADTVKEVDSPLRDKATVALRKFREQPQDFVGFDALWAIDVHGRVIASENFDKATGAEGFEMGGYPVVADALHGYIRDDSWLMGEDLWRVVARPVEAEAGAPPVGAIVAGKKVDDALARDVVEHTGAALVFYAGGKSIIKATPPSSETHLVGLTADDLAKLTKLPAEDGYQDKGRSKPALVRQESGYDVRAVFARLPGEAWDLGAGYAVMHQTQRIGSPSDFYSLATDEEKRGVPMPLLGALALAAALVGFLLTTVEYGGPLNGFKRGLTELANKGNAIDVLKPSTYRGPYKALAALVNDALDKVASTAGVERGPADLQQVLGPLSGEPTMSAFAVREPSEDKPAKPRSLPVPKAPEERTLPKARVPNSGDLAGPPQVFDEPTRVMGRDAEALDDALGSELHGEVSVPMDEPTHVADEFTKQRKLPSATATPRGDAGGAEDEETEWRRVYTDFLELKKQLGEPVEKLTYEKFRGTLQRNKDALVARHGCSRVAFKVYEKQGRAALKASPAK